MKRTLKNTLAAVLALVTVLTLLSGICSCGSTVDTGDAVKLSFKSGSDFAYLQSLDGKTVTINGYLATSSPADGSSIFLMNLPYQSCPFCKPNTSQLSNTLKVYPAKGKTFSYTVSAVKVTGTLDVAESEATPFTDEYGYEFSFKIVDASYTIISSEELGEDMALWNTVAQSGVVADIYSMFDYINFVCQWPTYYVNSYTGSDGVEYPGYHLWAADALNFLQPDGAQYHYGYVDGYFDDLIKKVKKIDGTKLSAIVSIIEKSKAIAEECVAALEAGQYTYENKYDEMFGGYDDIYTFETGDRLYTEFDNIYTEFTDWIAGFEM